MPLIQVKLIEGGFDEAQKRGRREGAGCRSHGVLAPMTTRAREKDEQ